MQFVPSTILALFAISVMATMGVRRGLWAFLAMTPFGAAAAFNLPALGGATIGVADLAAVAVIGLVALSDPSGARIVGTLRPLQPGFFFACVMVVALISALFAPRIFAGATEVFQITRNVDGPGIARAPLQATTGNITQLFRLALGFFVFVGLATAFRRESDARPIIIAMAVATGLNFALGWLDVLTYATGTTALLDPIRTANYSMHITDTMVGIKRMIGGFPEASSFGYFSLGMFGFWLQFWISKPGSKTAGVMLAIALMSVLRSTSSSAYLAFVVFLVSFGVFTIGRSLRPQANRRGVMLTAGAVMGLWLATVTIIASYELVEPVTDFFDRTLFDKLSTESGVERMSWNAQALVNFRDTWGLGAGIGSVRASNWFIACLSSFGVLGTGLMFAFLGSVALAPSGTEKDDDRTHVIKALKTGCLAMLCAAILASSTPDLGILFFALAGLATGVSRGKSLESLGGMTPT